MRQLRVRAWTGAAVLAVAMVGCGQDEGTTTATTTLPEATATTLPAGTTTTVGAGLTQDQVLAVAMSAADLGSTWTGGARVVEPGFAPAGVDPALCPDGMQLLADGVAASKIPEPGQVVSSLHSQAGTVGIQQGLFWGDAIAVMFPLIKQAASVCDGVTWAWPTGVAFAIAVADSVPAVGDQTAAWTMTVKSSSGGLSSVVRIVVARIGSIGMWIDALDSTGGDQSTPSDVDWLTIVKLAAEKVAGVGLSSS